MSRRDTELLHRDSRRKLTRDNEKKRCLLSLISFSLSLLFHSLFLSDLISFGVFLLITWVWKGRRETSGFCCFLFIRLSSSSLPLKLGGSTGNDFFYNNSHSQVYTSIDISIDISIDGWIETDENKRVFKRNRWGTNWEKNSTGVRRNGRKFSTRKMTRREEKDDEKRKMRVELMMMRRRVVNKKTRSGLKVKLCCSWQEN